MVMSNESNRNPAAATAMMNFSAPFNRMLSIARPMISGLNGAAVIGAAVDGVPVVGPADNGEGVKGVTVDGVTVDGVAGDTWLFSAVQSIR